MHVQQHFGTISLAELQIKRSAANWPSSIVSFLVIESNLSDLNIRFYISVAYL
jgi:hypothetical protein